MPRLFGFVTTSVGGLQSTALDTSPSRREGVNTADDRHARGDDAGLTVISTWANWLRISASKPALIQRGRHEEGIFHVAVA